MLHAGVMNERAVVLVHDRDPQLGLRNIGTIAPELASRGLTLAVHSFEWERAAPPKLETAAMVIVMGSPDAAYDDARWITEELHYVRAAIELSVPILGVCFGGQLLARALGGTVTESSCPEYGFVDVESTRPELVGPGPWMQFHGDTFLAPATATVIASNSAGQQAFVQGPHLGLQFHPEIDGDVFRSWADAWARDGVHQDEQQVERIRRDIEARQHDARARCSALLDAWISIVVH